MAIAFPSIQERERRPPDPNGKWVLVDTTPAAAAVIRLHVNMSSFKETSPKHFEYWTRETLTDRTADYRLWEVSCPDTTARLLAWYRTRKMAPGYPPRTQWFELSDSDKAPSPKIWQYAGGELKGWVKAFETKCGKLDVRGKFPVRRSPSTGSTGKPTTGAPG